MPVVNREVVLPVARERAWELITEPAELEELARPTRSSSRPTEDAPLRSPRAARPARASSRRSTEFERIVFRWGDSRVEWALEDAPGGTRFLVTEHRFAADTRHVGPEAAARSRARACLCPA